MLAKGEAFRMNHQFIGTEHLLLGLIVEGEGVGGIVLRDLGVELERARKEAIKLVAGLALMDFPTDQVVPIQKLAKLL